MSISKDGNICHAADSTVFSSQIHFYIDHEKNKIEESVMDDVMDYGLRHRHIYTLIHTNTHTHMSHNLFFPWFTALIHLRYEL